jgi:hypothetical protein
MAKQRIHGMYDLKVTAEKSGSEKGEATDLQTIKKATEEEQQVSVKEK